MGRPKLHKEQRETLSAYVPTRLIEWAKERATERGMVLSDLITEILEKASRRERKK
jgi:predicted DNA binding CopG/RHH family protein